MSNIPSYIMLLMEDIWKLSQDLNIYNCRHIYKEANRIADCLANKGICNLESIISWSNFPKVVLKFSFEDYCNSFFNRICTYSNS